MAAPFNLEDLAKLKSFVEFVAANPAILNTPQLYFLKKLIEQLGGKVPEGTFQMPAGAKCPFGGDVKSESKSTPPPASADEDEEEMPDMEAESEESEVELDMEANGSPPHLEPIYYMEEKPLKIVENSKSKRRKAKTKKGIQRRKVSKRRKTEIVKKSSQLESDVKLELETSFEDGDGQEEIKSNANDPLFTSQLVLKCELNEDKFESEEENGISSDRDEDFCVDKYEEDEDEEAEDSAYEIKCKKKIQSTKVFVDEKEELDEDDDKNGILTTLQVKSSRGNYKKTKNPRLKDCQEKCKHKCTTRFDRQQRLDIYHFYWQLSQEDKINFIRTHVRKSVSKYIRCKNIRNNCCYFLKEYKIVPSVDNYHLPEDAVNHKNFTNDDSLTKVCHKFFNGTLKISKQEIKEAFKNFELKPERIIRPQSEKKIEEVTNLSKQAEKKFEQPQLYLDPETGDLTDTIPKKKFKRRKPGDPLPQRYPKSIQCDIRCKFKCHQKFSEEERKQICDIFWSLDYKRRKDFILSRIETTDVKTPTTPEFRTSNRPIRAYQAKFYLRSGLKSENIRVCKHFMLNTLCITRNFIENAIAFADKTTGAYTGADLRGVHGTHNKINIERRRIVLDHINSYPFWLPNKKSKTKYLHYSLTIRKMYEAYKEKCLALKVEVVSVNSYYKVFHKEFHMLFLANPHPKKGRGFFKSNPNISHYTGDEPGGCWFDSKGTLLDKRLINENYFTSTDSRIASFPKEWETFSSESAAINLVQNPLKTFSNQNTASSVERSDLSQGSYRNLSTDSIQMLE